MRRGDGPHAHTSRRLSGAPVAPSLPWPAAAVRQGVPVPVDVPTLLASAGLSAVVAVNTAGIVARRKARVDRHVAARAAVRAAVQPVRQELARWARQGVSNRESGVAVSADPEAVAAV